MTGVYLKYIRALEQEKATAIIVLRHFAWLHYMHHFLLKYLVSRVKYDAAVEKLDLENR